MSTNSWSNGSRGSYPLAYGYTFFVFAFLYYDPKDLFWTATFLVNYFPDHLNSYNAHFWSLCVEVQFYFAIALVILCVGEKGLWIVWPACLAITAMRISEGAYIHIQTHLRGDEILAGACIATIYQSSWKGRVNHSDASRVRQRCFGSCQAAPISDGVSTCAPIRQPPSWSPFCALVKLFSRHYCPHDQCDTLPPYPMLCMSFIRSLFMAGGTRAASSTGTS